MNNRDPFNLRQNEASPLQTLLLQGAARAANISRQVAEVGQEAYTHTRQALEQTVSELQGAGPSPREKARKSDDDMSFAVPRNVPNFNDPGRAGAGGGGVTNRIPSAAQMFGNGAEKKGLPMYKDKPYNYAPSGRREAWWKGRRLLAGIGALLLLWMWWRGSLFGSSDAPSEQETPVQKLDKPRSRKGGKVDWSERRESVRDAFKLSWAAYEEYAWGFDEYKPISKSGKQMVPPDGLGWIIIDSLDTMMLMNLTSELAHARQWITKTLNYDNDHDVNTFETTIRMLGGLLSAHYLSTTFPQMAPMSPAGPGDKGEDLYLEKATDLADRLLGAYKSPSGVPWASVNLKTMEGIKSHADDGASSTAEATTLQLEMKYLANLTGESNYWEKAEAVMQVVDDNGAEDGLVPIFIYADKGTFRGENIRLGSRGDSYYEYLIKQYLQTNKQEAVYETMWKQALHGIRKHLLTFSSPSNFLVLGERPNGLDQSLTPKMDHLVCFLPGTIALGVTGGATVAETKKSRKWTVEDEEDMRIARELAKTCWGMYKSTATGLAPEIAHFHLHDPPLMYESFGSAEEMPKSPSEADMTGEVDTNAEWKQDFVIKPLDTHNLQRPETVESLFYMWRITGDEVYREWGWEMFRSFVNYTAVPDGAGFSSIRDVTKTDEHGHGWRDNMESFWLAETLKYLYLLFSPSDILPLDQVVFNTEAHPLPRFDMGKLFKTGWERKPRDASGKVVREPEVKHEHPSSSAAESTSTSTSLGAAEKTAESKATSAKAESAVHTDKEKKKEPGDDLR